MLRRKRTRTLDWDQARARLAAAGQGPRRLDAEESAALLRQRAAALAGSVDEHVNERDRLELLRFRLGNQACAIETRYIAAVLKSLAMTRLPGAPAHWLGVCNLRGEILPLFDLRQLRGQGRVEPTPETRVLVLGEQTAELCCLVDAIGEIEFLDEDLLLMAAEQTDEHVKGITRDALVVFDALALFADRQLYWGTDGAVVQGDSR
jgi:purine-binding chemotaxis protein CheW